MMKFILFAFTFLSFVSCSVAQSYSTKNKKAIKLFELGQNEPNVSLDPKNPNLPNYRGGLKYMEQALEKDSNFWEAHMFAGEYAEILGDYPSAIKHFESALKINPSHSPTGATYYYCGNLQYAIGDYDRAIFNLNQFISNKNANPQLVASAKLAVESCYFAKEAMSHPKKFNPINIGPGINTADPEYFPTITVDGKTILFTRRIEDQRVLGHVKEQEDFYFSNLSEQGIWMKAVPMPENINTVNNEGAPTIGPDGRSLVFVACQDQMGNYGDNRAGKGSCDLFITKKIGQRWADPQNIPGYINTMNWETQPSLSADGKTIYFIRGIKGRGDSQNSDIFKSTLMENGAWSMPERLPDYINTPFAEESVLIHPDGKTLYFASKGHVGMGGSDIYVTRLNDKGEWSKPENLGYPINTKFDEHSLMVSPEGEIAFFASNREGGFGDLDIYYFEMPEEYRPVRTLYFEGLVFDVKTKKPLPGKFKLIDLETAKEVIIAEADKVTGEFLVTLPLNKDYALFVEYPGYLPFSKNFNMKVEENQEALHMDVPMEPMGSKDPIILANVFFDLKKATLRPESFIELDKLVAFLNSNKTLKIEIGGHTDTRGDDKENMVLSNNRAKSVYEYLISKGIDASRLTYKGYGETQPKFTDQQISQLKTEKEKEKAHQENRRTEYKILP